MSADAQAEDLVTAVDRAEQQATATGRRVADTAADLDGIARWLAGAGGSAGWRGLAGTEARRRTDDAQASARALSGQCFFLGDVLRVEGSGLARAVLSGVDEREVRDADRVLAVRLGEAADALAGAVDPDARPCLDLAGTTDSDPRAIAALWHSLGPADRDRLARDHPDLGTTAGLPAAQRDALNRERLARFVDARVAPAAFGALSAHLAEDPGRYLLSVEAEGRAVVASANPDAADRVITLVPGTGSSLESIAVTATRADAVCDAAVVAAGVGTATDPATDPAAATNDDSCVSVAWQGYDAPPDLRAAGTSTDRASAYAPDLRNFAAGLDAIDVQDGDDAPHTVVGYSYGSTVLGAAAADVDGLAADRMVHVGSPGAFVDSLAEQRIDVGGTPRQATAGDVAAVASRWDPVPWWSFTGLLGAPPGAEEFGGVAADVTEPGPGDVRRAHSAYFDPGTVSLAEIGRLVVGRE